MIIGTQVNIIMPVYNAEKYIGQSVDSVISQTFTSWELLIINDASNDRSFEIASAYAAMDNRIKVLDLPKNLGVSGARNAGIQNVNAKYIAFLDSDDLWFPEKLEKQVAFMEKNSVSICYSWYQRMDETGKKLGTVKPPLKLTYKDMLKSNYIGNLTGIYNAEKLEKQSFSDFKHEDYVAWLELIKRAGKACGLPEVLACYRVYKGSTSSNKIKVLGWQWRIYRQNQLLGFWRSCFFMLFYLLHAVNKRF